MIDNSKPLDLTQVLAIAPKVSPVVETVSKSQVLSEVPEQVHIASYDSKSIDLNQAETDATHDGSHAHAEDCQCKKEHKHGHKHHKHGGENNAPVVTKITSPEPIDQKTVLSEVSGGVAVPAYDAFNALDLKQVDKAAVVTKIQSPPPITEKAVTADLSEHVVVKGADTNKALNLNQVLADTSKHLNAGGGSAVVFPLSGKVKVAFGGFKPNDLISYRLSADKKNYEFYLKGTVKLSLLSVANFAKYVTPATTVATPSAPAAKSTTIAPALAKRIYVAANTFYVSTPKLPLKKAGYKADVVIDTTQTKVSGGKTYFRLVKMKGNGKWESRVNASPLLPQYWVLANDFKAYPSQSSAPLNASGSYGDDGDVMFDPQAGVDMGDSLDPQAGMDMSQAMPQPVYVQQPQYQQPQQQYVQQPQYQQPQYQDQPQYQPVVQTSPTAQTIPTTATGISGQAQVTGQQVALKDANGNLFNNGFNVQPYKLLITTYFPVQNADGTTTNVPMNAGDIIWSDAPFDYNNIAAEHKGSFPDPNDPNGQLQRYAWTSVDYITPKGGLIPMRKDSIEIINDYQGQTMQASGGNTGIAGNLPKTKTDSVAKPPFGAFADDTSKDVTPKSNTHIYVGVGLVLATAVAFAVYHFKPEWLGLKKK